MYENYTMDVIATCAFATKTNVYKSQDLNPFVVNARKAFNGIHVADFATLIPAFVKRLLRVTITGKIGFFFDTTRHILATRRAHPSDKHNDFIQLMMEAMLTDKVTRDEQDTNEAHYVNEG